MRIENGYLVIENEPIKKKKITGHSFVDIAGVNPSAKKGDTILERMGLLQQDPIDKGYMLRGELAEKIVKHVYERNGFVCKTFDKKEINYDNFPENDTFGGLVDILLPKQNGVIEVKSKSMKDYEKIVKEQPLWEVMQGCYYAYLKKNDYFVMEWIFFDEETEKEVFEEKPITTLKNIKRFNTQYKMGQNVIANIEKYIQSVMSYYNMCYKDKKIPLNDISDNALKKLGLERPTDDGLGDLFATISF